MSATSLRTGAFLVGVYPACFGLNEEMRHVRRLSINWLRCDSD